MKKIILILSILFVNQGFSQGLSQKEKDLFHTENRTYLGLQKSRVSKLVNFMKKNRITSIGYFNSNQTYVKISPYLSQTQRSKLPSVTISKHSRFPAGELGVYVIGTLKGRIPYKTIYSEFDITGHTFAMFVSGKNSNSSFGDPSLEIKSNSFNLPTSLKLFSFPGYFKVEPEEHVNFTGTIIIPASHIQKLPYIKQRLFLKLFNELNGGR